MVENKIIQDKDLYMPCKHKNYTSLKHIQRNFGRHIVIALSVRPSVRVSVPLRVLCISPIFFEVGIPNLVCGCILG